MPSGNFCESRLPLKISNFLKVKDVLKKRKFNIGAFIQPNPNLFWTKLTGCRAARQKLRQKWQAGILIKPWFAMG